MTHKYCVHGLCKSSSRKKPNLKFAKFVQPGVDLARSKRWVHLMGRADFHVENVNKWTYVCQLHFPENADLDYHKNKDLEPYPPTYDRNKIKRLRRAEDDSGNQNNPATSIKATPTESESSESTPISDTPSAIGTLENARILAKLRCYTSIYKKYTLEEWKKFADENSVEIVKYLVVAVGSGEGEFEYLYDVLKAVPKIRAICLDGFIEDFETYVNRIRISFPEHILVVGYASGVLRPDMHPITKAKVKEANNNGPTWVREPKKPKTDPIEDELSNIVKKPVVAEKAKPSQNFIKMKEGPKIEIIVRPIENKKLGHTNSNNKVSKHRKQLRGSLIKTDGPKEFSCEKCDKDFELRAELSQHYLSFHTKQNDRVFYNTSTGSIKNNDGNKVTPKVPKIEKVFFSDFSSKLGYQSKKDSPIINVGTPSNPVNIITTPIAATPIATKAIQSTKYSNHSPIIDVATPKNPVNTITKPFGRGATPTFQILHGDKFGVEKKVKSSKCDVNFQNDAAYKKYPKIIHHSGINNYSNKPLAMQWLKMKAKKTTTIASSLNDNQEEVTLKCSQCTYVSKDYSSLEKHFVSVHEGNKSRNIVKNETTNDIGENVITRNLDYLENITAKQVDNLDEMVLQTNIIRGRGESGLQTEDQILTNNKQILPKTVEILAEDDQILPKNEEVEIKEEVDMEESTENRVLLFDFEKVT